MTDLSIKHVHVLEVGVGVNSASVRLEKAKSKVISSARVASVGKVRVRVNGKGRARGIVKRQQPLQNGVVFGMKPSGGGWLRVPENRHGVHGGDLDLAAAERGGVERALHVLDRRQHLVHEVLVVRGYHFVADGYEDDVAGRVVRYDVGVHPRFREVRVRG